jgi:hypothetical protein
MGARAITDLDSVKSWVPATQGVDDEVLERSLDTASLLIEKWCGRRFLSATYAARHSGSLAFGCLGEKLELADPETGLLTPYVSDIDVLLENGVSVSTVLLTTTSVANGQYAIYGPRLPTLKRVVFSGDIPASTNWQPGEGNIQIQYTAGYAAEDMPADISQACIELTWLIYFEGARSGMSSRNASTGSASFDRQLSTAAQSALGAHSMETVRRTLAA